MIAGGPEGTSIEIQPLAKVCSLSVLGAGKVDAAFVALCAAKLSFSLVRLSDPRDRLPEENFLVLDYGAVSLMAVLDSLLNPSKYNLLRALRACLVQIREVISCSGETDLIEPFDEPQVI
jgi:hypothetical protein